LFRKSGGYVDQLIHYLHLKRNSTSGYRQLYFVV